MARKRVKGIKYGKVTKQQKYRLLHACLVEQKSIHEAAFEVGVHYSTAKTILFFHKRQNKSYSNFTLSHNQEAQGISNIPRATYIPVVVDIDCQKVLCPTIQLISTLGARQQKRRKDKCSSRESTGQVKLEAIEEQICNRDGLYQSQELMIPGKYWARCRNSQKHEKNPQAQCEYRCIA